MLTIASGPHLGQASTMRQASMLAYGPGCRLAMSTLIAGRYSRLYVPHILPVRLLAVRALASKAVVVVESPTKAKKIQQFLGDEYQVLASYGHVRDLPKRNGSVLPDRDFDIVWELSRGAGPRLREIEQALRAAGARAPRSTGKAAAAGGAGGPLPGSPLLVLATDPDREGEAISWHLEQELQRRGTLPAGGQVQRITFTEVTKVAVQQALNNPRQVSQALVDAYLARRALDYLVGFGLSSVLWRRLPGARSAGRVQSVALRLAAEREDEIEKFVPQEYWSVDAQLRAPDGKLVSTTLFQVDGRKLQPLTGITSRQEAEQLAARIQAALFQVHKADRKQVQRPPPPPFTTATLQQEASSKLGFGAKRTMVAAQQLYEGAGTGEGLITYMRTDGLQLSGGAVAEIRSTATAEFGAVTVPDKPRFYKSRAKNAQEAHEAIRPTHTSLRPSQLPASLSRDLRQLYELVWRRALACQMANAVLDQVSVTIQSADGGLCLKATGSSVMLPGYLQAYDRRYRAAADQDQEDATGQGAAQDPDAGADNAGSAADTLAKLKVGDALSTHAITPVQHFTRPPPRYADASLIKELEQLGIGRPSTYASILTVLQDRGYITKEGRALHVSPLGRILSAFLQHYFPTYVDYSFTSNMEEQLDEVSGGRAEWRALLRGFWDPFNTSVRNTMASTTITDVYNMLDEKLSHVWLRTVATGQAPQLPPSSATSTSASSSSTSTSAATPTLTGATSTTLECPTNPVIDTTAIAVSTATSAAPSDPAASSAAVATAASGTAGDSPASNARVVDLRACPVCGSGRLVLKPSQYGGFIGCSNFATAGCDYKRPLAPEQVAVDDASGEVTRGRADGGRLLGQHPDSGLPVVMKQGPYGPYVELEGSEESEAKMQAVGEGAEEGVTTEAPGPKKRGRKRKTETEADGAEAAAAAVAPKKATKGKKAKTVKVTKPKPRRAMVPKAKADKITLEEAVALLSLPRLLGQHPQDNLPILANSGRFGPYVAHNSVFASLGKQYDLHDITLEEAVQLVDAKRLKLAARGILPRGKKAKVDKAKASKGASVAGKAKRQPKVAQEGAETGRMKAGAKAEVEAEVEAYPSEVHDSDAGASMSETLQSATRRGRKKEVQATESGEEAEQEAEASASQQHAQAAGESEATASAALKRARAKRSLKAASANGQVQQQGDSQEGNSAGAKGRAGGDHSAAQALPVATAVSVDAAADVPLAARRRGRPRKQAPG